MKRFVCDDCKKTVRQRRIDILGGATISDPKRQGIDRPVVLCAKCVSRHPGKTRRASEFDLYWVGLGR